MSSHVTREVHLVSRPDGMPQSENFNILERELPDPGPGEVLVENIYLSIDPAMRPPLTNGQTPLDKPMGGGALGQVVKSNDAKFSEGDYVQSGMGMRTCFVSAARGLQKVETAGEPLSTHMHVLGGTGLTAYGGLLVTGQLQDGENVFVSAAAGAVGSVAVQIAKIKQCRVVGSAGSDEKVAWLLDDLGLDYAFNYKNVKISKELHIGFPEGIDVYFDNVGGAHLDAACGQMRPLGRIPICGMISAYNNRGSRSEGVTTLANMIYNRVTMRGFVAYEFSDIREQFVADMREWISDGRMKYQETFMEGIDSAPEALIGLLHGSNTGKMMVRLRAE